ncbi:phage baseplate protein [Serratia liquefaciens]|uniref:phage baseplate protein n=1 Tax=Serratia liquefaciens TaxID=614 RepID=UPI00390641EC
MDILSAMFHQRSRAIGIIIPDVVISEKHSDTLDITEHPVEKPTSTGTGSVSDHAYRRPAEVVMEVGFAGGGTLLDFADTSTLGLSLGLSPSETYEKILEIQRSRVPFSVVTGKRVYNDMLIRAIEVTTDKTSENVLMAVLTLREVIITQTQKITVADKANMSQGVSTSAVIDRGQVTGIPVTIKNSSVLKTLFGGVKSIVGEK